VRSYNNILYSHIIIVSSDGQYVSMWHKYCSQYHSDANPSNDPLVTDFNSDLRYNSHDAAFLSIRKHDSARLESRQSQDYVFHILGQLDFTTICLGFSWSYRHQFVIWLHDIWSVSERFSGHHFF
jgi:hypothetical protein